MSPFWFHTQNEYSIPQRGFCFYCDAVQYRTTAYEIINTKQDELKHAISSSALCVAPLGFH